MAKTAGTKKAAAKPVESLISDQLAAQIAKEAYFLAEKRGFEAGKELDDWLAAEAKIQASLLQSRN